MRARVKGSADGVGKLGGVVVHDVMNRLDLSRPREALLAEAPGLTMALAGHLDAATASRCVEVVRRLGVNPATQAGGSEIVGELAIDRGGFLGEIGNLCGKRNRSA